MIADAVVNLGDCEAQKQGLKALEQGEAQVRVLELQIVRCDKRFPPQHASCGSSFIFAYWTSPVSTTVKSAWEL